jgi:putative ABC transport system substrate-binding protein
MAVARMNRRDILAALCGVCALGLYVRTNAQTTDGVRRIGSLGLGTDPTPVELQTIWAPARELGWIEGNNLIVERRRTMKAELLQPYAEELVRLNVELIITVGTTATVAARNATTRIPIVMYTAGDPVAAGLVTSLSRPGGNVTGYSMLSSALYGKGLSLLHEMLPSVQRVGLMIHRHNPYSRIVREEGERTLRALGVQLIVVDVENPGEIDNAVAVAARRGAQALYVTAEGVLVPDLVMRSAMSHALPAIAADREYAEAGALASLAPDESERDRVLAYFIDKILRGAKPADLPIQQPTRFVLSINLKTAKALGLTIPRAVLERADEVIQ